jgi:hypothetical protein
VEGLIRVDIFKRKDDKLFVNEFESFEADRHPGGYYKEEMKYAVDTKLEYFHLSILQKYVDQKYFDRKRKYF